MSDSTIDEAKGAEKAHAKAAAEAKAPAANEVAEPKKPVQTASRKSQQPVPKPAAGAVSARAKRARRVAKAAAAAAPAKATEPKPTVTELKEKIMATAETTDFTKPIADAVGEFQARTKAAYDKSTEVATELTEFTKGNVEALVESSKIFAAGAQSLSKTYVEDAKAAYETATADAKEFAAIKSPTELFQLQSKIARRNFDAFVAASSKNTEAFLKLSNEAFAPLSGRVEAATEKLSKVA